MRKKIISHFSYYILLITIFVFGLIACLLAYPHVGLQIIIVSLTIIFYVFWGIFHHKKTHQLTNKIMIEYILIGILGLAMIFFIFMGGSGI